MPMVDLDSIVIDRSERRTRREHALASVLALPTEDQLEVYAELTVRLRAESNALSKPPTSTPTLKVIGMALGEHKHQLGTPEVEQTLRHMATRVTASVAGDSRVTHRAAIRKVLITSGRPMGALEIINGVRESDPDRPAKSLEAELQRMRNDKSLVARAKNSRGSLYVLNDGGTTEK